MVQGIQLSAHELELLKLAIPLSQRLQAAKGRSPTQEELQRELSCARASATNIQHYLLANDAVKTADHLEKLPENAEGRAVVQFALGDTSGSLIGHVLRKNANLQRQLTREKYEEESQRIERSRFIREEIEAIKADAKAEIKRKPSRPSPVNETGFMLEVSLFDVHFGKLAWPNETGGVPYDLKIAEAMFMRAIDKLVERARGYKYELVLFPIGNDLFQANDADNQTVHGTVVDVEGRFQKTYWVVRKALVEAVEKLKEVAPVKVMACYGNHDKTATWTLADSLECWFHNDPDVTVENSPVYRKYQEWGKVGLMFTHGDLGIRQDYPLLFAAEEPELWGRTEFREVHTGDLHTTRTQEWHGIRVRILGALTPADAWHAENGYVGNLRTAEAFVWSKTEGLIAQYTYCDDAFEPLITKREIRHE